MNRGESRPKGTESGKSSILIKEIDQEISHCAQRGMIWVNLTRGTPFDE